MSTSAALLMMIFKVSLLKLDINSSINLRLIPGSESSALNTTTFFTGGYVENATMVASVPQTHPLALKQASAYVSRGELILGEYPQVFA